MLEHFGAKGSLGEPAQVTQKLLTLPLPRKKSVLKESTEAEVGMQDKSTHNATGSGNSSSSSQNYQEGKQDTVKKYSEVKSESQSQSQSQVQVQDIQKMLLRQYIEESQLQGNCEKDEQAVRDENYDEEQEQTGQDGDDGNQDEEAKEGDDEMEEIDTVAHNPNFIRNISQVHSGTVSTQEQYRGQWLSDSGLIQAELERDIFASLPTTSDSLVKWMLLTDHNSEYASKVRLLEEQNKIEVVKVHILVHDEDPNTFIVLLRLKHLGKLISLEELAALSQRPVSRALSIGSFLFHQFEPKYFLPSSNEIDGEPYDLDKHNFVESFGLPEALTYCAAVIRWIRQNIMLICKWQATLQITPLNPAEQMLTGTRMKDRNPLPNSESGAGESSSGYYYQGPANCTSFMANVRKVISDNKKDGEELHYRRTTQFTRMSQLSIFLQKEGFNKLRVQQFSYDSFSSFQRIRKLSLHDDAIIRYVVQQFGSGFILPMLALCSEDDVKYYCYCPGTVEISLRKHQFSKRYYALLKLHLQRNLSYLAQHPTAIQGGQTSVDKLKTDIQQRLTAVERINSAKQYSETCVNVIDFARLEYSLLFFKELFPVADESPDEEDKLKVYEGTPNKEVIAFDSLSALGLMFNYLYDFPVFQDKVLFFQVLLLMTTTTPAEQAKLLRSSHYPIEKLVFFDNDFKFYRFKFIQKFQYLNLSRADRIAKLNQKLTACDSFMKCPKKTQESVAVKKKKKKPAPAAGTVRSNLSTYETFNYRQILDFEEFDFQTVLKDAFDRDNNAKTQALVLVAKFDKNSKFCICVVKRIGKKYYACNERGISLIHKDVAFQQQQDLFSFLFCKPNSSGSGVVRDISVFALDTSSCYEHDTTDELFMIMRVMQRFSSYTNIREVNDNVLRVLTECRLGLQTFDGPLQHLSEVEAKLSKELLDHQEASYRTAADVNIERNEQPSADIQAHEDERLTLQRHMKQMLENLLQSCQMWSQQGGLLITDFSLGNFKLLMKGITRKCGSITRERKHISGQIQFNKDTLDGKYAKEDKEEAKRNLECIESELKLFDHKVKYLKALAWLIKLIISHFKTHAIKENQFSELLAKCIKVVSADQELQKHSTIDDQMKETNEGIQYTLEQMNLSLKQELNLTRRYENVKRSLPHHLNAPDRVNIGPALYANQIANAKCFIANEDPELYIPLSFLTDGVLFFACIRLIIRKMKTYERKLKIEEIIDNKTWKDLEATESGSSETDIAYSPMNIGKKMQCYVFDSHGRIIYKNPSQHLPKIIYADRSQCNSRFKSSGEMLVEAAVLGNPPEFLTERCIKEQGYRVKAQKANNRTSERRDSLKDDKDSTEHEHEHIADGRRAREKKVQDKAKQHKRRASRRSSSPEREKPATVAKDMKFKSYGKCPGLRMREEDDNSEYESNAKRKRTDKSESEGERKGAICKISADPQKQSATTRKLGAKGTSAVKNPKALSNTLTETFDNSDDEMIEGKDDQEALEKLTQKNKEKEAAAKKRRSTSTVHGGTATTQAARVSIGDCTSQTKDSTSRKKKSVSTSTKLDIKFSKIDEVTAASKQTSDKSGISQQLPEPIKKE